MEREFILHEIRRTAASNGGHPLGKLRFEAETGIREYDVGRHWIRWNDAVREAGLQPNSLIRATPYDEVLNGVAQLTRELGHIPTQAELRIYKMAGRVASSDVIRRIAPTKDQLARSLLDYCEQHQGLDEVAAICRAFESPTQARRKPSHIVPIGEVYLIKSGRYYKIGFSISTGRRTREFEIQLPEMPSRIHAIRTDDPRGVEAYWHKRFEAKRVRPGAEFFKLDAVDVKAFCAWKRIV